MCIYIKYLDFQTCLYKPWKRSRSMCFTLSRQMAISNFTEMILSSRCFAVSFPKIFRVAFLQNISGRLLLNFLKFEYTWICGIFYAVILENLYQALVQRKGRIKSFMRTCLCARYVLESNMTIGCRWNELQINEEDGRMSKCLESESYICERNIFF